MHRMNYSHNFPNDFFFAWAIVILKPYAFSDILFAIKARNANGE